MIEAISNLANQPSQIGFTLVSSHFLGSSRYSLSVTGIAFVPFGNATSIEVLDSKSFRDDSRPTASMIFCPSSEISHSAKSFAAFG